MAVNLSPVGGVAAQFFDNSGQVLTGGLLYSYLAGTTTPAVTYTTSSGITANTNPVVLNAAGRVPDSGEIWLTDGISYKFVLQDQFAVQIATYDNIVGINSNFIAYTGQTETQTATQEQTIFTLTTIQYLPATNNLSVYVNGSKQIVGTNFQETSTTVITFVDGLNVGDIVEFNTAESTATNATTAANVSFTGFKSQNGNVQNLADDDGSDWIGFLQSGTNAVAISAQDKMRQTTSVKDFGAVGDGVVDDTAAIQAAIDSFATSGSILFPKGTYKVSATIDLVNNPRISLIGEGQGISIIQATTSFTGTILIDMQNASSTYGAVNTISGLTLLGSTGATTGINQNFVNLSTLENLYIQGFSAYGIYADNTFLCNWQTIKLQSCGVGFYLNGANHSSSFNNLTISNSTVSAGYVGGSAKVDGNSSLVFNSLHIDSANATSASLLKIDTGGNQFSVKFNDCYIGEFADGGRSIIEMITGTAIFENGIIFAEDGNMATLTGGVLEINDLDLRLKSINELYTGTTGQLKLNNAYTTMKTSSAAFSLAGDTLQPNNLVRTLVATPYGKNWTGVTSTGAFTITNGNVGKTITCTSTGFAFMSTPLSSAYRLGSNAQIVVVYSSNIALELVVSQGAGSVAPSKQIGQKDLPSTAGVTSTFIDTGLLSGTLDQLYTTLEFRANAGNPYANGDSFTIFEVYLADVSTTPRLLSLAKE